LEFLSTLSPAAVAPFCTGEVFLDVNSGTVGDSFCGYIEEFARRGFTDGCGEGDYCHDATVTRVQMAVFLATALTRDGIPD
jgi:hypothetical protein